jgi:exoribonuclease R
MFYKIHIDDRNYLDWKWYNDKDMKETDINKNPIEFKLFTGDIVDINGNLKESIIRDASYIPGILLSSKKTYGRNSKDKFYYKCLPNDKRLPAFLIAYNEKQILFDKKLKDNYVLFKFQKWDDKHPIGSLTQTIGDINELVNFYEYQLYCKNLYVSLKKFTNNTMDMVNKKQDESFIKTITDKYKNIEDRSSSYNVFTIDPNSKGDLDDAMSIDEEKMSVYIANVPLLLDYYNLWESFSKRISTIYLPDRKRPMLPSILSEQLCSLLENESRIAFCMDIYIKDYKIIDIKFSNVIIKVKKNYVYDELSLLENKDYKKIKETVSIMCREYKYIKSVSDSHDVVAFLMILMNYESAKIMLKYKTGIYRNLKMKEMITPSSNVPDEILNFVKIWQCSCGSYNIYNENNSHELIGGESKAYIHITSPIRRLVDLLNIVKIQEIFNYITVNDNLKQFYDNWINNLEYINTSMRAIRRVQIDCSILDMCTKNTKMLETEYQGYLFDKVIRDNKFNQYTVYLPELKIISRINLKEDVNDYSHKRFKIYLINDEATLKKKIRLQCI